MNHSSSNVIRRLPQHVTDNVRSTAHASDLPSAACELVLNSIQAGARSVHVTVNLPSWSLTVDDDGCGVSSASIPLVGQHLCTSKQGSCRGESLASLAHLSQQITITTRAAGTFETHKKQLVGPSHSISRPPQQGPSSAASTASSTTTLCPIPRQRQGTTVQLVGFLHNQPVRRNRLLQQLGGSSTSTAALPASAASLAAGAAAAAAAAARATGAALHELKLALLVLTLPFDGVELVLQQAGSHKPVLHLAQDRCLQSCLGQLFQQHPSLHHIPSQHSRGWQLSGCVLTAPAPALSTKQHQLLYVNSRAACCPELTQLLKDWFNRHVKSSATDGALGAASTGQPPGINRSPEPGYVLLLTCPTSSCSISRQPGSLAITADFSASMGPLCEVLQAALGPHWGTIPSVWRKLAAAHSHTHPQHSGGKPVSKSGSGHSCAGSGGASAAQGVQCQPGRKAAGTVQLAEPRSKPWQAPVMPSHGLHMTSLTRSLAGMQATAAGCQGPSQYAPVPCSPQNLLKHQHLQHTHQGLHVQQLHQQQQQQQQELLHPAGNDMEWQHSVCDSDIEQLLAAANALPGDCTSPHGQTAATDQQHFSNPQHHQQQPLSAAGASTGAGSGGHSGRAFHRCHAAAAVEAPDEFLGVGLKGLEEQLLQQSGPIAAGSGGSSGRQVQRNKSATAAALYAAAAKLPTDSLGLGADEFPQLPHDPYKAVGSSGHGRRKPHGHSAAAAAAAEGNLPGNSLGSGCGDGDDIEQLLQYRDAFASGGGHEQHNQGRDCAAATAGSGGRSNRPCDTASQAAAAAAGLGSFEDTLGLGLSNGEPLKQFATAGAAGGSGCNSRKRVHHPSTATAAALDTSEDALGLGFTLAESSQQQQQQQEEEEDQEQQQWGHQHAPHAASGGSGGRKRYCNHSLVLSGVDVVAGAFAAESPLQEHQPLPDWEAAAAAAAAGSSGRSKRRRHGSSRHEDPRSGCPLSFEAAEDVDDFYAGSEHLTAGGFKTPQVQPGGDASWLPDRMARPGRLSAELHLTDSFECDLHSPEQQAPLPTEQQQLLQEACVGGESPLCAWLQGAGQQQPSASPSTAWLQEQDVDRCQEHPQQLQHCSPRHLPVWLQEQDDLQQQQQLQLQQCNAAASPLSMWLAQHECQQRQQQEDAQRQLKQHLSAGAVANARATVAAGGGHFSSIPCSRPSHPPTDDGLPFENQRRQQQTWSPGSPAACAVGPSEHGCPRCPQPSSPSLSELLQQHLGDPAAPESTANAAKGKGLHRCSTAAAASGQPFWYQQSELTLSRGWHYPQHSTGLSGFLLSELAGTASGSAATAAGSCCGATGGQGTASQAAAEAACSNEIFAVGSCRSAAVAAAGAKADAKAAGFGTATTAAQVAPSINPAAAAASEDTVQLDGSHDGSAAAEQGADSRTAQQDQWQHRQAQSGSKVAFTPKPALAVAAAGAAPALGAVPSTPPRPLPDVLLPPFSQRLLQSAPPAAKAVRVFARSGCLTSVRNSSNPEPLNSAARRGAICFGMAGGSGSGGATACLSSQQGAVSHAGGTARSSGQHNTPVPTPGAMAGTGGDTQLQPRRHRRRSSPAVLQPETQQQQQQQQKQLVAEDARQQQQQQQQQDAAWDAGRHQQHRCHLVQTRLPFRTVNGEVPRAASTRGQAAGHGKAVAKHQQRPPGPLKPAWQQPGKENKGGNSNSNSSSDRSQAAGGVSTKPLATSQHHTVGSSATAAHNVVVPVSVAAAATTSCTPVGQPAALRTSTGTGMLPTDQGTAALLPKSPGAALKSSLKASKNSSNSEAHQRAEGQQLVKPRKRVRFSGVAVSQEQDTQPSPDLHVQQLPPPQQSQHKVQGQVKVRELATADAPQGLLAQQKASVAAVADAEGQAGSRAHDLSAAAATAAVPGSGPGPGTTASAVSGALMVCAASTPQQSTGMGSALHKHSTRSAGSSGHTSRFFAARTNSGAPSLDIPDGLAGTAPRGSSMTSSLAQGSGLHAAAGFSTADHTQHVLTKLLGSSTSSPSSACHGPNSTSSGPGKSETDLVHPSSSSSSRQGRRGLAILALEDLAGPSHSLLVPGSVSRQQLQLGSVIAQADKKLLVVRCGSVLLAVDQHAADERVQLEALQQQLAQEMATDTVPPATPPAAAAGVGPSSGGTASAAAATSTPLLRQFQLQPPQRITLTLQEARALQLYQGQVEAWGWKLAAIPDDAGASSGHGVVVTQQGNASCSSSHSAVIRTAGGTQAGRSTGAVTAGDSVNMGAAQGGTHGSAADMLGTSHTILLQQVPLLAGVHLGAVDLQLFLHQLLETSGGNGNQAPPGALRVLRSKACRGAVMFGDTLRLQQCRELLQQLASAELCFMCAHGRPTTAALVELCQLRSRLEQWRQGRSLARRKPCYGAGLLALQRRLESLVNT